MNVTEWKLEDVLALPVYKTADIFPMLPKSVPDWDKSMTLGGFASQLIADGGVLVPLVVWDGKLLDGRNRSAAAALAGLGSVPVREEFFESENEADRFVISQNIARRQMTKTQTAATAVLYIPLFEGRQGKRTKNSTVSGRTTEILAEMFHVNRSYIDRAKTAYLNDFDGEFQRLHSGRKTLVEEDDSPGQKVSRKEPTAKEKFLKAKSPVKRAVEKLFAAYGLNEDVTEQAKEQVDDFFAEMLSTVTGGQDPVRAAENIVDWETIERKNRDRISSKVGSRSVVKGRACGCNFSGLESCEVCG